MARFCFYCQRELKEGERCSCRTARIVDAQRSASTGEGESVNASEEARASGPSQAASEPGEERRPPRESARRTRAEAGGSAEPKRRAGAKSGPARESFRRRFNVDGRRFRFDSARFHAFAGRFGAEARSFLRQIPQLLRDVLRRPESIIELARSASTQRAFIFFLLEIGVSTLVLGLAYGRSVLGRFLAFSFNRGENGPAPWLIFLGFSVLAYFLRLNGYILFLRLNFIPVTFKQAMRHAVPGGLYFTLMLFFAIFFTRSSGIQVLFILALAWALRFLIDARILRTEAHVPEERRMVTLIGIYLFTFLILALAVSFALPEMTRVRPPVTPTIGGSPFVHL